VRTNTMNYARLSSFAVMLAVAALVAACGGRKPPVASAPVPPAPAAFPSATTGGPPPPPEPPAPPRVAGEAPVASTNLPWDAQPLDVINGPDSPLKPVFFAYDSDELDDIAKKTLADDADVLKTYKTWVVTIEGHCDERGTPEYNLALGDRRALAAKNYLMSLGIAADRIRTVSYGSEFPFDPAHVESAWIKNRRAHFMLTSK
jgi:peptidoglycan-associated lipoprotein